MRPVARAKGQGTIVPIGDSPAGRKRWRVAVTMPDGNRVWRTAHSLREAERLRQQLVEARELDLDPTRQTLADYLRSWIAGLRDARHERIRPTTLDHYTLIVERHIIPALGAVKLSALTARRVQAWLDADPGSARTVHHHHAVLRRALNVAVRHRLLAWNPATAVELPDADDDKADPLTLEEARALLDATREDRLGPLWRLALVTGLRQGELLGLAWDDIEPGAVVVRAQLQRRNGSWYLTAPKAARKVQRIAIDPDTAAMLDAHRLRMAQERTPAWQYHGLVFPTPEGQPYQRRQVLREWDRACEKAGIRKRRMHDTRATSATLLREQGVTEDTRMARLGHNTTDMARHYAKASEAQDRAAADGLGRALGGAG